MATVAVTTCVACGKVIGKSYERRCLARCDSDVFALWKYTLQSVLDDDQGSILDAIGSDEHSYLCRQCIAAYNRVCCTYKTYLILNYLNGHIYAGTEGSSSD